MSLRNLAFVLVALAVTAGHAAPALAGPGHWRPHLQVQVALPLPPQVAYAPAPLSPPPVYLHSAAPPAHYAAPHASPPAPPAYYGPPAAAPAQQWVWVEGGFVQQSCGSRAWAPAHWELRPVATLHHGHGHRHGAGYAKAYGARYAREWRR